MSTFYIIFILILVGGSYDYQKIIIRSIEIWKFVNLNRVIKMFETRLSGPQLGESQNEHETGHVKPF